MFSFTVVCVVGPFFRSPSRLGLAHRYSSHPVDYCRLQQWRSWCTRQREGWRRRRRRGSVHAGHGHRFSGQALAAGVELTSLDVGHDSLLLFNVERREDTLEIEENVVVQYVADAICVLRRADPDVQHTGDHLLSLDHVDASEAADEPTDLACLRLEANLTNLKLNGAFRQGRRSAVRDGADLGEGDVEARADQRLVRHAPLDVDGFPTVRLTGGRVRVVAVNPSIRRDR